MDQAKIDEYFRKGFVTLEGVFSQVEIEELSRVTDEFVDRSRSLTAPDAVFDLDIAAGHSAETPKLRRIKTPHKHHPAYRAALDKPEVLDIVAALVGDDIRIHHSKLNAKAPGGGAAVEWHTDWGYYPHSNDDLLEVGVAIDDITLENGCLMIIPGTHREHAHDHHEGGVFVGAVPAGSFDMNDAEPILLKKGDISIHHVRALHGSAPNLSDKPRRLLLLGYAAVDAWPLMALHQPKDWDAWNAEIIRGKPTHDFRMENIPVRIPLPAPSASGLFEIQENLKTSHYAGVS
jgi:phytanoyl-CoA hydroxylase